MDDEEAEREILQVLRESPVPLKALDIQRKIGKASCTKPIVNRVLHNRLKGVKAEITNHPLNPPLWRVLPTAQRPPPCSGVVASSPQLSGGVASGGVAAGLPSATGDPTSPLYLHGNPLYTLTPVRARDASHVTVGRSGHGGQGSDTPQESGACVVSGVRNNGGLSEGIGGLTLNSGASPDNSSGTFNLGNGGTLLNNLDDSLSALVQKSSGANKSAAKSPGTTQLKKTRDPNLSSPMQKFPAENNPEKTCTNVMNNMTLSNLDAAPVNLDPTTAQVMSPPSTRTTAQVTSPPSTRTTAQVNVSPNDLGSRTGQVATPTKNPPTATTPPIKKGKAKKKRSIPLAAKFPPQPDGGTSQDGK